MKIKIKKRLIIIAIAVIIPSIVMASETKTQVKTETKVATNIKKEIEPLQAPETVEMIPEPVEPIIVQPTPVVEPTGGCVDWITQAGITDIQNAYTLIMRESGCRVDAYNASSGAQGIPQSLPGSKMASAGDDWQTNPITQLRWMESYVISRYGSWANAVGFSNANGWY